MSVSGAPRKTSINPRMAVLVLAAAVAAAYVLLGASLLRQSMNQNDLSSQLDSAQSVLADAGDVQREAEALPGRLAEANQELAVAQVVFPSELHSNDIMQTLLALADENQVSVLSADTVPPEVESSEDAAGAEPSADAAAAADASDASDAAPTSLTFDLEVAGDLGHLVQFVEALGLGTTSTTTVSNVRLQEVAGAYVLDIEVVAHERSPAMESSSPEDGSTAGEGTEAASGGEETPSE